MAFIEDLQKLVELESPSEDLKACRAVVELAVKIADENLNSAAEIVEENGRPVFWIRFGQLVHTFLRGALLAISQKVLEFSI